MNTVDYYFLRNATSWNALLEGHVKYINKYITCNLNHSMLPQFPISHSENGRLRGSEMNE